MLYSATGNGYRAEHTNGPDQGTVERFSRPSRRFQVPAELLQCMYQVKIQHLDLHSVLETTPPPSSPVLDVLGGHILQHLCYPNSSMQSCQVPFFLHLPLP